MPDELDPRYFLTHFKRLLGDVRSRYPDLLSPGESTFLSSFDQLAEPSQALLVRLVMRRHDVFRSDAIIYAEVSDTASALAQLAAHELVSLDRPIDPDMLGRLTTKPELLAAFPDQGLKASQRKCDILARIAQAHAEPRTLAEWLSAPALGTVHLECRDVVDGLRLLFFGNLHQDWSEFVVSELGHVRYETVDLRPECRAFTCRQDIEACRRLHHLQHELAEDQDPARLLAHLSPPPDLGALARYRWSKFQHRLGEAAERRKDWLLAKQCYEASAYKLSRHRLMRIHEKLEAWDDAWRLAVAMAESPASESEYQSVIRALPRLSKRVGESVPVIASVHAPVTERICLPAQPETGVERAVVKALTRENMQVHWLENTLFNGLFGLLFWEVIFAPVPGAFFHAFQQGPADLYHPEFSPRREALIQQVFSGLESDDLADRVINRFDSKHGIANPFVVWQILSEDLLRTALAHVPRQHLRVVFERMLRDLRANTSGFPDLVAFDRLTGRYELIEVKGPGDRVQDNQARWMDHFQRHGIPCRVLQVSWPSP